MKHKVLKIYHNANATIDPYTVIYTDCREGERFYSAYALGPYPFHPQGFGQHCTAMLGRHLGLRIKFSDLPPDCQKAVRLDRPDLFPEEAQ